MKTGLSVHDVMITKPIQVVRTTTVRDCCKIMADKKVGSLLVSNHSIPVGIITEEDIVRKILASGKSVEASRAEDCMTNNLVTVSPSEDVHKALLLMRNEGLRHLPVIDNGELIGIITMKDILELQPDLFEILAEKISISRQKNTFF